jgi:Fur family transcriptional regulator, ferric uptake regulator
VQKTRKALFVNGSSAIFLFMLKTLDIKALLHAAGLRRTPVRAGVIQSLVQASKPMSVTEILSLLPPDTDSVTVYRTLNTLVEKNMAQRVRNDDRSWLYEMSVGESSSRTHAHAHFLCDQCGKIECLPDVTVQDSKALEKLMKPGYHVREQEVTVRGTCAVCAK